MLKIDRNSVKHKPGVPPETQRGRRFLEICRSLAGNRQKICKCGRSLLQKGTQLTQKWSAGVPKDAQAAPSDPQMDPRRVGRLVLTVGFWHSGASRMRAPPRKYKDFGGFGDVRNGLAQQGTQRHDKHVRPPAGATAGLV